MARLAGLTLHTRSPVRALLRDVRELVTDEGAPGARPERKLALAELHRRAFGDGKRAFGQNALLRFRIRAELRTL